MAITESSDEPTLFNEIGLHLIKTPEAAWRDIESAAMGWDPSEAPETAWAADFARDWLRTIMAPDFAPAASAAFLAYPLEASVCDTVRGLYRVPAGRIEVAQSRYLVSLKLLDLAEGVGGDACALASGIAEEAFAGEEAKNLVFKTLGQADFGSYGARDFSAAKALAPGWAHWADAMHWWSDGKSLGFLTLRGYGEMVREVASADPFPNRSWFSREPARMLSSR